MKLEEGAAPETGVAGPRDAGRPPSHASNLPDEKSWGLPFFLTPSNKYPIGAVAFAVAAGLYLASNHLHFIEPMYLPMWRIDKTIPFIPQTVFIYISEYLYFPTIYLLCRDMKNANKYLYSFLGLQMVSVLIFWVWPTTYPRDLYPLPADLDPFTAFTFGTLRQADSPTNCCPSLHVSSVLLSAYIFLDEQRDKFPYFILWGSLIALSTLTTKQHYMIDVLTGIGMSVIAYWLFHRMIPYRAYRAALTPLALQAKR